MVRIVVVAFAAAFAALMTYAIYLLAGIWHLL